MLYDLEMYYARDSLEDEIGRSTSSTFFADEEQNRKLSNLLASLSVEPGPNAAFDDYANGSINLSDNLHSLFRTSFKLSNGSPLVQSLLMIRSAQIITLLNQDPDVLAQTASDIELAMDRFIIPTRHKTSRKPHRIESRAQATWDFFLDVLRHPNDPDLLEPRDAIRGRELELLKIVGTGNFIPFALTKYLLEREVGYMQTGRPQRPDVASRYRSMIRECGFLQKPTGSFEIDVVMQEVVGVIGTLATIDQLDLPDLLIFTEITPQFETLKSLWEERHQRSFLPSNKPQLIPGAQS